MHTAKWLLRLPFWLLLILREMGDMGEDATNDYVLFLTLGTTCFAAMAIGTVTFERLGTALAPWLIVPGAIYLLLGIVLFFRHPLTNASIHWTRNGAW
jgi:uncharacterized membrane protein HdeD (DUF308 family)